MQNLRDLKFKRYPFWRLDKRNLQIIKGGWHFSYLKEPKGIQNKLRSYLHHVEYDENPLGIEKIKKMVDEKKPIYDLKVDQRKNKFDTKNQLIKVDKDQLPSYILNNLKKFEDWIEND